MFKHYKETGCVGRHSGSGQPSKITAKIKQIVEEQMRKDNETSAFQLQVLWPLPINQDHFLVPNNFLIGRFVEQSTAS